MRKLIILLVVTMMLTGCSSESKQKKQLEKAGRDYYEKYMSSLTGINEAQISLDMIKKVNEEKNAGYKISALKQCDDSTQILFTIEKGKIADIKYELNCK
jgi:uncharacterized lipoprotein